VSAPRTTGQPRLREVLASPKMLAILILAAASGFPNQITESVLQAWLKDSGASNTTIGVMSYVALPYLLKFLWAPFVDRYSLPLLGRRRGWMLAMQLALAAPSRRPRCSTRASPWHRSPSARSRSCSSSATQDIAIDAYRADVSLPSERGLAAAAANLGYRSASWIAVAVALVIADHFGWRLAFLILAAAMALFAVATVRAPAVAQHLPAALAARIGGGAVARAARHAERPDAARRRAAVQGGGCLRQQAVHALHDGRRLLEDRDRRHRQGAVHGQ